MKARNAKQMQQRDCDHVFRVKDTFRNAGGEVVRVLQTCYLCGWRVEVKGEDGNA